MTQPADLSELDESELRATLKRSTGYLSALRQGFSLAAKTAGSGLPLALAYGLIGGAVGYQLIAVSTQVQTLDPATLDLASQIGTAVAVLLLLYGGLQFTKRDRASRASWFPALFAVPAVLLTGGLMLAGSPQARQYGPVVIAMFVMPWWLLWSSIGGAATAIGWVRAGHEHLEGRSTSLGELLDEIRRRTVEISGPHGGRVHAVTLGFQVLVPGIFYWLQLAFTDMVAVLRPDRASLKRSGALTFGMRGRLFRLMLVWGLGTQVLAFGIGAALEGDTTPIVASMLGDPGQVSILTYLVTDVVWALSAWVVELALLVLYVEREGQVAAKRELRRREKEAAAPDASQA